MTPDEINSVREILGELRGQMQALTRQLEHVGNNEQLTHERLAQLKQDLGIHLAFHKMLDDKNTQYFSRQTAVLAATFSILGALVIAIINFVLSRILVGHIP